MKIAINILGQFRSKESVRSTRSYPKILLIVLFLGILFTGPSLVLADCNCEVSLYNSANGEITIKKVKTAKAIKVVDGFVVAGIYKTQWQGKKSIRVDKRSKFKFTVDFCNSRYLFRFQRKDGKQCTRAGERGYRCGTSNNPLEVSCSARDWR